MVKVEGTLEELNAIFGSSSAPTTKKRKTVSKKVVAKPKRKQSKYNLFMKKELPKLRKKHPRMKQAQLMKKAAANWRRTKK